MGRGVSTVLLLFFTKYVISLLRIFQEGWEILQKYCNYLTFLLYLVKACLRKMFSFFRPKFGFTVSVYSSKVQTFLSRHQISFLLALLFNFCLLFLLFTRHR